MLDFLIFCLSHAIIATGAFGLGYCVCSLSTRRPRPRIRRNRPDRPTTHGRILS